MLAGLARGEKNRCHRAGRAHADNKGATESEEKDEGKEGAVGRRQGEWKCRNTIICEGG